MDTITTAVEEITIDSSRIIHETEADLITRNIPNVIRLVQYDQTLPVIAVALKKAGVEYALPANAACNIRIKKPDGTVIYNPAYGCDSTRKIVYFEVTYQTAVVAGELNPVIEVVVTGKVAGTSALRVIVEENPVQAEDEGSEDERETIIALVGEAEQARDDAIDAKTDAVAAKGLAEGYASDASGSASSASTNALKAEGFAVGKQNGVDVGSGSDYYHANAKYYKEEAATSATNAAASAAAAADSEAWAVGKRNGTDVPSTDPQYQNNSKFWSEQAAASAAMLDAKKILGNFAHYEETNVASRAYAVCEHLTYNGYLYRVTTAISQGGTITPGTNVVQTTVGDEIQGGKVWKQAQAIASTSGSSGTLCTITDDLITADHVLTKFVPANSSYIISGITCTPSAGQVVITGISTAATTAEIMLEKPDKVL